MAGRPVGPTDKTAIFSAMNEATEILLVSMDSSNYRGSNDTKIFFLLQIMSDL
jgi:hypothetical protein